MAKVILNIGAVVLVLHRLIHYMLKNRADSLSERYVENGPRIINATAQSNY